METWLILIAFICVVLSVYLFSKRKSATGTESEAGADDAEDNGADDSGDDTADEVYGDDEDFEYDDVAPYKEETAEVVDMRIEPRITSRVSHEKDERSRDDLLLFLVDFKLEIDGDDEITTLSVPADVYDLISVGETARLMTQNDRFIDFGDKCAELAETEDDDDETERIIYDDYDGDIAELVAGEVPAEDVLDDNHIEDAPVVAEKKKPAKKAEDDKAKTNKAVAGDKPKTTQKATAETAKVNKKDAANQPKSGKSAAKQK